MNRQTLNRLVFGSSQRKAYHVALTYFSMRTVTVFSQACEKTKACKATQVVAETQDI